MADDLIEVERAWFREHPEPEESAFGDKLSLWNYAIGRADIAPAHQADIRDFLGVGPLGPARPDAEVNVRGHASASGEAADNAALSAARADKVAAYVSTLGIKTVNRSSAGASEPEDRSPFGGAYARNRRVDVQRFYPSATEGTTPLATAEPQTTPDQGAAVTKPDPGPKEPGALSSFGFEVRALTIPLISSTTTSVTYAISFELNGKGTFKGPAGGVEEAATWDGDKRAAKFAVPVGEQLKLRLQGAPATKAEPPSGSIGLQVTGFDPVPGSGIEGKVEFGLQTKPNFVYFSGSLGKSVLGPIDVLEGVTAVLEVEVKLRIEAGLSSEFITTMLRRSSAVATEVLAELEEAAAQFVNRLGGGAAEDVTLTEAVEVILARLGPGLAVGAAAVGWFAAGGALAAGFSAGFAAIVNSCVAEAEAQTYVFARRAGAAGRLAVEIFAGDATTVTAHSQRSADYLRLAGGSDSQKAFMAGDALAAKRVAAQSSSLDEDRKRWRDSFAKGANPGDYDTVSDRVFRELGGLTTAPRDLEADVNKL